jgi:hypothetical protein
MTRSGANGQSVSSFYRLPPKVREILDEQLARKLAEPHSTQGSGLAGPVTA